MNNEAPLLSIIVPTYNRQKMLSDMLVLLLPHLSSNMEIIVVDDGSTDGTVAMLGELCREWTNLRFIVQNNSGPGAARNRGVAESSAIWIAFLDSDDLWLPWTTMELKRIFTEETQVDEANILFLQVRTFSESEDLIGWPQQKSRIVRHLTMYDMRLDAAMAMLGSCNFVIRRKVFNSLGGFSTDLFCGEDTDLFYRAGNIGEIWSVVSPVMVAYRVSNSDSLTLRQAEMKRAASHLLQQYANGAYPGPSHKRDAALHKTMVFAMRSFFSKGYVKYAYSIYLESLPLFLKVKDFHNIVRIPLTPFLHLIRPSRYSFRWRPER